MKSFFSAKALFQGSGLRPCRGATLIVTLSLLVIATILVVGMLSMVLVERSSARNVVSATQARFFSDMAAGHATTLIRDAIMAAESSVTEPLPESRKFWASQPGRITVFHADGTIDTDSTRALHSIDSAATAATVDLNAAPFGGHSPIMSDDGSGSAPVMAASWINVLADPSSPPSEANPVVGRYAFWVDDESTKLNINTADGSAKGTALSFGTGSPAEVNLQSLVTGANALTAAEAEAVAIRSGARHDVAGGARPFNTIREILQTDSLPLSAFELNFQDITIYNRSPELNIFGEPKIYLATSVPSVYSTFALKGSSTPLSLLSGPYAAIDPAPPSTPLEASFPPKIVGSAQPLTWLYPSSGTSLGNSQLPAYRYTSYGDTQETAVRLPQLFRNDLRPYASSVENQQGHPALGYPAGSLDYDLGMRIARYLKGWNSQGYPLIWPHVEGAGSGGFSAKYTDRQIDDITVQILSMLKQTHQDHFYNFSLPYYIPTGFLSGKPVRGANRGPRLTEVVMRVTTIAGDPPQIQIQIVPEFYLPKEVGGSDLTFGAIGIWAGQINAYDVPVHNETTITGEAPLGGYWADTLLKITDQNGLPAGVDLLGNPGNRPDPDQAKAALYHHPWALQDQDLPHDPVTNPYMGTGPPTAASGRPFAYPVYRITRTLPVPGSGFQTWALGDYLATPSRNFSVALPTKSGVTSVTIGGGLAIWMVDANRRPVEAVPIDSVHPFIPKLSRNLTAEEYQRFQEALILIPGTEAERTIPIPGRRVFHLQVADPFVNAFPGDWEGTVLDAIDDPIITMPSGAFSSERFYQDGKNHVTLPEYQKSIWWPEQNISIPKSQRFPSSGYLQYLRTGVMPDFANDTKPLREQKGTPWRMLNFSPSTAASQQTDGGESYPDWLWLDLFTTPAIFQPLGTPVPPAIVQTWGGATAGRINPNGVLYPFNIERTKPVQALFKDLAVTLSFDAQGDPEESIVDEAALASAVTAYIAGRDRPLMLPGEICNVPGIAAQVYSEGATESHSRNDLIRQTIGNLTTRSNTFTVWAAGEAVQKRRGNTGYGVFEAGDTVLGRSRVCYVVERYLDPGSDGVYGNAIDPGPDGVVNTPDDPLTAAGGAHPPMSYPLPYRYRVILVTQVE